MRNQMTLRPFHPDDAEAILSWCKDKQAFRLWSADRYKEKAPYMPINDCWPTIKTGIMPTS